MATENENSNTTEATNETVVGGDNNGTIKQGDQITQQIDSAAPRFPIRDPENQNNRVDQVISLMNLMSLNPDQLWMLSGGTTLLGVLGFIASIFSMIPGPSEFMTWMSVVDIPFSGPVIAVSFVAMIAGGYILDTFRTSKCPKCKSHLSLRVTDSNEVLHSGDDVARVERHLACDSCTYKTVRRSRDDPNTSS